MKVVVMPGFSELIIKVNPSGEVTREGLLSIVMPWLYAPWPEAKSQGIIPVDVAGDTLRELIAELSTRYQQANIDFEPINPATGDMDADYDVLINGKDYISLPRGLDTKLAAGDEVRLKILWRCDG